MTQRILERKNTMEQILNELSNSYSKGQIPSYEKLKAKVPDINRKDYAFIVESYIDYMRDQELVSISEHDKTLKSTLPFLQEHNPPSIKYLDQEIFRIISSFVRARETLVVKAASNKYKEKYVTLLEENDLLRKENEALRHELNSSSLAHGNAFIKSQDELLGSAFSMIVTALSSQLNNQSLLPNSVAFSKLLATGKALGVGPNIEIASVLEEALEAKDLNDEERAFIEDLKKVPSLPKTAQATMLEAQISTLNLKEVSEFLYIVKQAINAAQEAQKALPNAMQNASFAAKSSLGGVDAAHASSQGVANAATNGVAPGVAAAAFNAENSLNPALNINNGSSDGANMAPMSSFNMAAASSFSQANPAFSMNPNAMANMFANMPNNMANGFNGAMFPGFDPNNAQLSGNSAAMAMFNAGGAPNSSMPSGANNNGTLNTLSMAMMPSGNFANPQLGNAPILNNAVSAAIGPNGEVISNSQFVQPNITNGVAAMPNGFVNNQAMMQVGNPNAFGVYAGMPFNPIDASGSQNFSGNNASLDPKAIYGMMQAQGLDMSNPVSFMQAFNMVQDKALKAEAQEGNAENHEIDESQIAHRKAQMEAAVAAVNALQAKAAAAAASGTTPAYLNNAKANTLDEASNDEVVARANKIFDALEEIKEKVFEDKDSSDLTSFDFENIVSMAIENNVFPPEKSEQCRRVCVKLMMLGRSSLAPKDLEANDDDILASLPHQEQAQFAHGVLAWGKTRTYLNKDAVDEGPLKTSSSTNIFVSMPSDKSSISSKVNGGESNATDYPTSGLDETPNHPVENTNTAATALNEASAAAIAEANAEANADATAEAKANADATVDANVDAKAEANADAEAKAEAESGVNAESVADATAQALTAPYAHPSLEESLAYSEAANANENLQDSNGVKSGSAYDASSNAYNSSVSSPSDGLNTTEPSQDNLGASDASDTKSAHEQDNSNKDTQSVDGSLDATDEESNALAMAAMAALKSKFTSLDQNASASHHNNFLEADDVLQPAQLLNSRPMRGIPRDEDTILREMADDMGDDSVAAVSQAASKLEQLIPLLNEAGKEFSKVKQQIDHTLDKDDSASSKEQVLDSILNKSTDKASSNDSNSTKEHKEKKSLFGSGVQTFGFDQDNAASAKEHNEELLEQNAFYKGSSSNLGSKGSDNHSSGAPTAYSSHSESDNNSNEPMSATSELVSVAKDMVAVADELDRSFEEVSKPSIFVNSLTPKDIEKSKTKSKPSIFDSPQAFGNVKSSDEDKSELKDKLVLDEEEDDDFIGPSYESINQSGKAKGLDELKENKELKAVDFLGGNVDDDDFINNGLSHTTTLPSSNASKITSTSSLGQDGVSSSDVTISSNNASVETVSFATDNSTNANANANANAKRIVNTASSDNDAHAATSIHTSESGMTSVSGKSSVIGESPFSSNTDDAQEQSQKLSDLASTLINGSAIPSAMANMPTVMELSQNGGMKKFKGVAIEDDDLDDLFSGNTQSADEPLRQYTSPLVEPKDLPKQEEVTSGPKFVSGGLPVLEDGTPACAPHSSGSKSDEKSSKDNGDNLSSYEHKDEGDDSQDKSKHGHINKKVLSDPDAEPAKGEYDAHAAAIAKKASTDHTAVTYSPHGVVVEVEAVEQDEHDIDESYAEVMSDYTNIIRSPYHPKPHDNVNKSEAKTDTKANTNTEATAEYAAIAKSESKVESEASVKSESKVESEASVKSESKTGSEASAKSESKVESEANAKSNSEVGSEANAKSESAVDSDDSAKSKTTGETEANAQSEASANSEAKADDNVGMASQSDSIKAEDNALSTFSDSNSTEINHTAKSESNEDLSLSSNAQDKERIVDSSVSALGASAEHKENNSEDAISVMSSDANNDLGTELNRTTAPSSDLNEEDDDFGLMIEPVSASSHVVSDDKLNSMSKGSSIGVSSTHKHSQD